LFVLYNYIDIKIQKRRKIMRKLFIVLIIVFGFASCEGEKELKIISASPDQLDSGSQSMIEINGEGFTQETKVWFGAEQSAQINFNPESKKLIALSPKILKSGRINLKVENPGGVTSTLENAITVMSKLEVTKVMPSPIHAGVSSQKIRIRGENFIDGVKVVFGDTASSEVIFKNKGLVLAELPVLSSGIYDVSVINPDGAKATLFDSFQILSVEEGMPIQKMQEMAEKYKIRGQRGVNDTGISFADINNDGHIDIIVGEPGGLWIYVWSEKGYYEEISEGSGVKLTGHIYGAYLADFDNDGLTDLFVTGKPCQLFRNLGNNKFEDVTERVGFPAGLSGWSASWADYDLDGNLDIFIGEAKTDDHLFKNSGAFFTEVMHETFAKDPEIRSAQPSSFSCAFSDYDNDGYPDLIVGTRGYPSALYKNMKGEKFVDVTDKMGLDFIVAVKDDRTIYKLAWGISWADYNNDSWMDLIVSSSGTIDLYKNNKGKGFIDSTKKMRAIFTSNTINPVWGDLDNDGYLDLAISENLSSFRVYKNNKDGSFTDISDDLGIIKANTLPMSLGMVDVNMDGALDIFVIEFSYDNKLYINTPVPGRHFVTVILEGTKSNLTGIGSTVKLYAKDMVLTRRVGGGEGQYTHPSPWLHFGLGTNDKIDKIVVTWPTGEEQVVENVEVDKFITITEPGERKPVPLPEVEVSPVEGGAEK
jgi:ASPIC/UnbV protein/VCBS repeat protein/IPT/TIG domain-containing protein